MMYAVTIGAITGVAMLAGVVGLMYSSVQAQTPQVLSPNVPHTEYGVTSYNQSGGITAGTVNIGAPKLNFNDPSFTPLKQIIMQQVDRTRPLVVMAVLGDSTSMNLAIQVHQYLNEQGFKMLEGGISQGIFSGPVQGFQYDKSKNELIVGGQ